MPRNPRSKNQHNGRHENGLVGPGKRITKQKSNGHINGSARGAASEEPTQATSLPNAPISEHAAIDASATDAKKDVLLEPRSHLKHFDSETSNDGQEVSANGTSHQNGSIDGKHRRSDAVPPKTKIAYDLNPAHLASTILRSCPGTDTVALLIFLLALPSMMLTIVQAFFASLTFMPPSGLTSGTLWSFLDLFNSAAGSPSIVTTTMVDLVCLALWFCLWSWARNFALDLAQVQIALTLGGGNASKGGGVNSVCVALVLVVHLVRSRGVRDFFFGNALYTKLSTYPSVAGVLQYLPSQADFGDSMESPSTIRSLIAVHIIAQAVMAFVRRSVANTPGTATAKSSKRIDPEALAGAHHIQDLQTADSMASVGSASGVDYQPPPTPGHKESKDKAISAKKRRRQANQIRSRQPFWAALASTKVHVMREYEHTRGSYKTSQVQDTTAHDTSSGDEAVWITGVDSSTIQFESTDIAPSWQDQDNFNPDNCNKPITVRINGAKWQVYLEEVRDAENDVLTAARWRGEITGLAPNCTYECSFSRAYDKTEFACISVKTPPISDKDVPRALVPATRQPGRSSSPITTIKNSIQSSETKLLEARNRMTKTRRVHKTALARVEKEIESMQSRLNSTGDEKKLQQKLLQAERNKEQTDEAIAQIDSKLRTLDAIPEDDNEEHSSKKKDYQERNASLATANQVLEAAKATANVELSNVNSELSTVTARKDRLVSRQARLSEQYERITQANAQGLNEKERKAADSAAKVLEHERIDRDYIDKNRYLQSELTRLHERTAAAWQEVHNYETQIRAQQEALMRTAGPPTPEGNLPGTNPFGPARSVGFGFNMPASSIHAATTMPPVYEPQHSPFLAYANTLPDGSAHRARSSTNRSTGAGSNFSADFDDADPIPPMPTAYDFDVKGANGCAGSDSSRGKNNGSPSVIGAGLGSPIRGRNSPGQSKGIW